MKMAIRFDACAACDEVLETGFRYCLFIKCLNEGFRITRKLSFFVFLRATPCHWKKTFLNYAP